MAHRIDRSTPDFLCIGAPKCGTSWLYKQLSAHPQVWLPPVKELRYFNKRFPIAGTEQPPGRRMGLYGLFPAYPRRVIVHALKRTVAPRHRFPLGWTLRYLSGPGDFDWYRALFAPAGDRVTGDITPFYASLSAQAVGAIHAGFPRVRLVFLMRDPVARAWSNARMMLPLLLERPLEALSEQDFLDYLARPAAHVEGRYLHTLRAWGGYYPPGQMLIEFHDHIASEPQRVLDRITAHLGLAPLPRPEAALRERVNAGSETLHVAIPPSVRLQLSRHYLEDLERLAERFGEPVTGWLSRARACIDAEDG